MTISMKKLVSDAMAAGLQVDVKNYSYGAVTTIRRDPDSGGIKIWPNGIAARFDENGEFLGEVSTPKEMREILGLKD